ncbi:MAG: hypothetical protein M5U19_13825 [Microthrixaceae bacterium]|nr:hypothetical protein [Microthrixaceae bacterium]
MILRATGKVIVRSTVRDATVRGAFGAGEGVQAEPASAGRNAREEHGEYPEGESAPAADAVDCGFRAVHP